MTLYVTPKQALRFRYEAPKCASVGSKVLDTQRRHITGTYNPQGLSQPDSKALDIEKLRTMSFEQNSFAQSIYSRQPFGEIFKNGGSPMPMPFDSEGFANSVIRLPSRHLKAPTSIEKLGQDLQLINDTFFMPATAASLLVMDKNNKPHLWNGKTYAPNNLERNIEDWQIASKNSLYQYLTAPEHKGSALQFLNLMYLNEQFIRHVPEHHEILFSNLGEAQINKEQIKWFKNLEGVDLSLLTNRNPNRGPRTFAMTSATLLPLWDGNHFKGILLLGYEPGGALFSNPDFDRNSVTYLMSLCQLTAKILSHLGI